MFTKALVAIELSDIEKPMLDCLREMRAIGVNELVLVHARRPVLMVPHPSKVT